MKSAYKYLIANEEQGNLDNISGLVSMLVWSKIAPHKVSIMAWRLLKERLSTKENLERRLIVAVDVTKCLLCGRPTETAEHMFLHYTTMEPI